MGIFYFMSNAPIDGNHHKGMLVADSITNEPVAVTGEELANASVMHVAVVDGSGNQITSFGSPATYQSFNDTTTDTNLVYLGKAVAGTDATDAAWQIKRYNKSAGTMTFADDATTFTKIWDDRTTYSY